MRHSFTSGPLLVAESDVDASMRCSLCCKVFENPVSLDCERADRTTSHVFCRTCIIDKFAALDTLKCPVDGEKFKRNTQRSLIQTAPQQISDTLAQLRIKCDRAGCPAVIVVGHLELHAKTCSYPPREPSPTTNQNDNHNDHQPRSEPQPLMDDSGAVISSTTNPPSVGDDSSAADTPAADTPERSPATRSSSSHKSAPEGERRLENKLFVINGDSLLKLEAKYRNELETLRQTHQLQIQALQTKFESEIELLTRRLPTSGDGKHKADRKNQHDANVPSTSRAAIEKDAAPYAGLRSRQIDDDVTMKTLSDRIYDKLAAKVDDELRKGLSDVKSHTKSELAKAKHECSQMCANLERQSRREQLKVNEKLDKLNKTARQDNKEQLLAIEKKFTAMVAKDRQQNSSEITRCLRHQAKQDLRIKLLRTELRALKGEQEQHKISKLENELNSVDDAEEPPKRTRAALATTTAPAKAPKAAPEANGKLPDAETVQPEPPPPEVAPVNGEAVASPPKAAPVQSEQVVLPKRVYKRRWGKRRGRYGRPKAKKVLPAAATAVLEAAPQITPQPDAQPEPNEEAAPAEQPPIEQVPPPPPVPAVPVKRRPGRPRRVPLTNTELLAQKISLSDRRSTRSSTSSNVSEEFVSLQPRARRARGRGRGGRGSRGGYSSSRLTSTTSSSGVIATESEDEMRRALSPPIENASEIATNGQRLSSDTNDSAAGEKRVEHAETTVPSAEEKSIASKLEQTMASDNKQQNTGETANNRDAKNEDTRSIPDTNEPPRVVRRRGRPRLLDSRRRRSETSPAKSTTSSCSEAISSNDEHKTVAERKREEKTPTPAAPATPDAEPAARATPVIVNSTATTKDTQPQITDQQPAAVVGEQSGQLQAGGQPQSQAEPQQQVLAMEHAPSVNYDAQPVPPPEPDGDNFYPVPSTSSAQLPSCDGQKRGRVECDDILQRAIDAMNIDPSGCSVLDEFIPPQRKKQRQDSTANTVLITNSLPVSFSLPVTIPVLSRVGVHYSGQTGSHGLPSGAYPAPHSQEMMSCMMPGVKDHPSMATKHHEAPVRTAADGGAKACDQTGRLESPKVFTVEENSGDNRATPSSASDTTSDGSQSQMEPASDSTLPFRKRGRACKRGHGDGDEDIPPVAGQGQESEYIVNQILQMQEDTLKVPGGPIYTRAESKTYEVDPTMVGPVNYSHFSANQLMGDLNSNHGKQLPGCAPHGATTRLPPMSSAFMSHTLRRHHHPQMTAWNTPPTGCTTPPPRGHFSPASHAMTSPYQMPAHQPNYINSPQPRSMVRSDHRMTTMATMSRAPLPPGHEQQSPRAYMPDMDNHHYYM